MATLLLHLQDDFLKALLLGRAQDVTEPFLNGGRRVNGPGLDFGERGV